MAAVEKLLLKMAIAPQNVRFDELFRVCRHFLENRESAGVTMCLKLPE
jgi:hypothetical protein